MKRFNVFLSLTLVSLMLFGINAGVMAMEKVNVDEFGEDSSRSLTCGYCGTGTTSTSTRYDYDSRYQKPGNCNKDCNYKYEDHYQIHKKRIFITYCSNRTCPYYNGVIGSESPFIYTRCQPNKQPN